MILQSALNQVIEAQKANLSQKDSGLKRDALATLPDLSSFALIVSWNKEMWKKYPAISIT